MDWPGSVGYGRVGQDLKWYLNWFKLDVLDDFQNLFSFLGKCIFLKTTSPEKSRCFSVYQFVDHTVHIRTKTCMKIVSEQRFFPKISFFFF